MFTVDDLVWPEDDEDTSHHSGSDDELEPVHKKVKFYDSSQISDEEMEFDEEKVVPLNIFQFISDDVFLSNVLALCSFKELLGFRLISKHVNSVVISFFASDSCKVFANITSSARMESYELSNAANIQLSSITPTDPVSFFKTFHNAKVLQCSKMEQMFFLREVPFSRLEELHLVSCSFDMLHLQAISAVKFDHLKLLRLDSNRLRNDALQFLNKTSMPKLTNLCLAHCHLTEAGVQHILDAKLDLEVLVLDGNSIKREGFLLALKLPLQFLSVMNCDIEIQSDCSIETTIETVNVSENNIYLYHQPFVSITRFNVGNTYKTLFRMTKIDLLRTLALHYGDPFVASSLYFELSKDHKSHSINQTYFLEKSIYCLKNRYNAVFNSNQRQKALYKLGKIIESQKHYHEAKQVYQQSSYPKSYIAMAMLYFNVEKNWEKALSSFKLCCDLDEDQYVFELGTIYYHLQDYEKSEYYLSLCNYAAESKKKQADRLLGLIYYKGLETGQPDYTKAFKCLIADNRKATQNL